MRRGAVNPPAQQAAAAGRHDSAAPVRPGNATSARRRISGFARPCTATAALLLCGVGHAQIVLDGFTIGDLTDDMNLGADAAGTFAITENLGLRAANNLFHSFREFELASGQTALFSGDSTIANVIARVTGGRSSMIDGTISSTIGSADFWLVNPAGLFFGANAAIDVGGAFNAGAADFIAFPNDLQYSAFDDSITLSVANPVEFGFLDSGGAGALRLGPDPAANSADPGVRFAPGTSRYNGISFAGRTLSLTNGTLGTEAGLEATGDIVLDADELTVTNSSLYADTAGALDAGTIELRGGTLRIDQSVLTSASTGAAVTGAAGQIIITGTENVTVNGADFDTTTVGSASSGNFGWISIAAGEELRISASTFDATSLGSGDAGFVDFDGRDVQLEDVYVESSSLPGANPGAAGQILVTGSDRVALIDSEFITSTAGDAVFVEIPGYIHVISDGELLLLRAELEANTSGAGAAGVIELSGDTVVLDAATLASESESASAGLAGSIVVTGADSLTVRESFLTTQSFSDAVVVSGDLPGEITLDAGGALELHDTVLTADTLGNGAAGQIDIGGNTVLIVASELTSGSTPPDENATTGVAGVVEIEGTTRVELRDSLITTQTFSDAAADNADDAELDDVPGSIEIVSGGELLAVDSHVTASTDASSDAGFIALIGGSIRLEGTEIASSSQSVNGGWAGDILLSGADGVTILGYVGAAGLVESLLRTDTISREDNSPGTITVTSAIGDIVIRDAVLTSDTLGASDAGQIDLDGVTVLLERAEVTSGSLDSADTSGSGAPGIVEIEGRDRVELLETFIATETFSDVPTGINDPDVELDDVPGSVEIETAGELRLVSTDITATTFGRSDAGFVHLGGATIELVDVEISSTSESADSGAPGVITITAAQALDVTRASVTTSTISDSPVTVTYVDDQGETVTDELIGYIEITVVDGDLVVSDSRFSSTASGVASAGFIDIAVGGDAAILGGLEQRSSVTTLSERSEGGDVTLTLGGDLDIAGGLLEASAGALGNGGDVKVTAGAMFVRDSGIFARAEDGDGGLIALRVTGTNLQFVIDTESLISADSGTGINGEVDINAPDADLAASLQTQDANIVVAPELAADACSPSATGELSTFVQEDAGGTPLAPDRYLSAQVEVAPAARAASPARAQIAPVTAARRDEPATLADDAGAAQRAADLTDPREACR